MYMAYHYKKNDSGLTLSRQRALKILRKELFHATLVVCASKGVNDHTSRPYTDAGKQYDFKKWIAIISFLFLPNTDKILLSEQ